MVISLVDVEELLIQGLLRLDTDVQAAVDTRVYTIVPSEPTFPLVRVQRLGGGLVFSHHAWLDRARVEVNVWGDTAKATWRVADVVRNVLIAGQGASYAPFGRLDGIEELSGPSTAPETSGKIRLRSEYLVLVRPLPETS